MSSEDECENSQVIEVAAVVLASEEKRVPFVLKRLSGEYISFFL